ncbi:MAG: hybrid sensor histidine kinase/response regulator, partial [Thermoleophilia bacterium]|nr:hybrid sensor histidine kinase/response regulator [Thermoleophilia bacterium]
MVTVRLVVVVTTVELWLPISLDTPNAEDASPVVVSSLTARGIALLVDDEPLVRMSTADMLADLGYNVIEA